MYAKKIQWFGRTVVLACDAKCSKAWGICSRPKEKFDPNEPDDFAFLADDELGEAPENPGTYEGGHAKPKSPEFMNKWCARQCERSRIFEAGEAPETPDFAQRRFNQPWKHTAPSAGSDG